MKKSLLMVLLLVALAATSFAGLAREGAQFVLQTKDGQSISGELLAVKHSTLILKDTATLIGISVDVYDLESIRLIRNPKVLLGGGIGLVVGGLTGYAVARALGPVKPGFGSDWERQSHAAIAIIFGLFPVLAGGFIGARAGVDRTISVAGQPETEIQWLLKWLRSKAGYEKESY